MCAATHQAGEYWMTPMHRQVAKDNHKFHILLGLCFQTELELSSQDHAADPPDTAYASMIPCTAP